MTRRATSAAAAPPPGNPRPDLAWRDLTIEILREFVEAAGLGPRPASPETAPQHGGKLAAQSALREERKARGECIHCGVAAKRRRDGRPGTECEFHIRGGAQGRKRGERNTHEDAVPIGAAPSDSGARAHGGDGRS